MSAHTPGPWEFVDVMGACSVHANGCYILRYGYSPDQEQKANARLIAAAPELLELVKAAFQWIDAVPKNTPLPSMPGLDRDWANSIIAKAESQS